MNKSFHLRRPRHCVSVAAGLLVVSVSLLGALKATGAEGPGGGGTTFTTSATNSTTNARIDLPNLQTNSTRVLAFDGRNSNVLYDSTTPDAPASSTVTAAFQQASQILKNAGLPHITGPTLLSSSSVPGQSVLTSSQTAGTTFTLITTTTIGPKSIFIGDNLATSFFVAAGNINVDILTQNQTTINQLFQATTLNSATYGFTGLPNPVKPVKQVTPVSNVTAAAAPPPMPPPVAPVIAQPILLVDVDAILSLGLSGQPVALAQREVILQISGVATRDVNGRLFRLRSGEFDEDAGQPGPAGGDGKSGKEISSPQPERPHWKSYVSGDYGYADQENVGRLAGFDGSTYAGTVGAELDATKHLTFGLAGTYLENRTGLGGGALGRLNIKGTAVSAYAAWHTGHFYLDGLYSFGRFEDELHRNTLLGSTAQADPYADSNVVELHTGYNFHLGRLVTGPLAGLRYTHSELDSYTEHGGGSADVSVGTQKTNSLVSELGWQASVAVPVSWGKITFQARTSWQRENLKDDQSVSVGLVDSPFLLVNGNGSSQRIGGFGLSGTPAQPGDDYFVVGGGVQFDFGERFSLLLDYQENLFRSNRSERFASVRGGFKF